MTQLVWFKRDLRLSDHAPLTMALGQGPCILLYCYEPELYRQPDFDSSHLEFINQCLRELGEGVRRLGGQLTIRVGEMVQVLDQIHQSHPFETLWSHEETGNGWTYQRDRAVKQWARSRGVRWLEIPQNGVVRVLRDRDGWSRNWNRRMAESLLPTPHSLSKVAGLSTESIQRPSRFGLSSPGKLDLQVGGEREARCTLDSFLGGRGVNYRRDMSSPVTAWDGCSRLSPYLAYGAISMKTVHQRLELRRREIRELRKSNPESVDSRWAASLSSFAGRLRWHCHFMQKLEDEPRIEFENMASAYDGVREEAWNQEYFERWKAGQTGFPMVDACIRALRTRSWINFRMRAMLMSFAAYDLFLHWREPALFLARNFLDYEPGIHYSQCQMQSGTTGINTMRIYSPAKQVRDQDPTGQFIREWVPELNGVPDEYLPEPEKMPKLLQLSVGCQIGKHYPEPIVDHKEATAASRRQLAKVRRTVEARAEAADIVKRHGSRRKRS